ncbi:MAG: hypothetical protein AAGU11_08065 [Syntrophobacteraceae bacterium]
MRYFVWLDFQYQMLAFFMGLVSVILVYIAWASYPKRREARTPEELDERRGHEIQSGHDPEGVPIAPFLIFIYVLIAFWSVFYMLYVWMSSSKF